MLLKHKRIALYVMIRSNGPKTTNKVIREDYHSLMLATQKIVTLELLLDFVKTWLFFCTAGL